MCVFLNEIRHANGHLHSLSQAKKDNTYTKNLIESSTSDSQVIDDVAQFLLAHIFVNHAVALKPTKDFLTVAVFLGGYFETVAMLTKGLFEQTHAASFQNAPVLQRSAVTCFTIGLIFSAVVLVAVNVRMFKSFVQNPLAFFSVRSKSVNDIPRIFAWLSAIITPATVGGLIWNAFPLN